MQIYIKTLSGKKVAYNIETDNTIQQLKMQLQEKEGISAEQFKVEVALIFKANFQGEKPFRGAKDPRLPNHCW